MPGGVVLFDALLDSELCPWGLLPGRLHCEFDVRRWDILQHNIHKSNLRQWELLSAGFNRHKSMPSGQRVQLSLHNRNVRSRFVLPPGINTASALRLRVFLPKHHRPDSVSDRDRVRSGLYRCNRLPDRDVLRRREFCGHRLSSRQSVHIEQLKGGVPCQPLLWAGLIHRYGVSSPVRLAPGKQFLHQLQLPRRDLWEGAQRFGLGLQGVRPGGLLHGGRDAVRVLMVYKTKSGMPLR